MKHVVIIHGFNSSPNRGWRLWLKKELIKKGFKVTAPQMPAPAQPKGKAWLAAIEKAVGKPNKNTVLVGHSLGVIAILRYLETLKKGEMVGGVISVAGRIIPNPSRPTYKEFFKKSIKWPKIRKHCSKFVGIYSRDDKIVAPENGREFKKKSGADLIWETSKGHFTTRDKVMKLQSALKSVLDIT